MKHTICPTIFNTIKEENKKLKEINKELLEACKEAKKLLKPGQRNNIYAECVEKLEQAISKAEGE